MIISYRWPLSAACEAAICIVETKSCTCDLNVLRRSTPNRFTCAMTTSSEMNDSTTRSSTSVNASTRAQPGRRTTDPGRDRGSPCAGDAADQLASVLSRSAL